MIRLNKDVELNKWYLHTGKYPMMIFAIHKDQYIGVEFVNQDLWSIDYWSNLDLSPWDDRSTFSYDRKIIKIKRAIIDNIFFSGKKHLK